MSEAGGPCWVITTSSLEQEPEERRFESRDGALDYAVAWFVGGLEFNTGDPSAVAPFGLAEDVERLIADLRGGRKFQCSRFYEEVTLHHDAG